MEFKWLVCSLHLSQNLLIRLFGGSRIFFLGESVRRYILGSY